MIGHWRRLTANSGVRAQIYIGFLPVRQLVLFTTIFAEWCGWLGHLLSSS